jgi:RimJ/RimL family protein N-acetyltransferase
VQLRPVYPVEAARLRLRPLTVADTDAIVAYRSLPEVARYVPFEPMTKAGVKERLTGQWARQELDDEEQALLLGVELRETGELVGDVMLAWRSREHLGGELGYVFSPDHAGKGYATEASHALLHLAFDDLGLRRMIARLDARNDASARVLLRLGMRQEAHLIENELFKGEWGDELDFAILASEWSARTPVTDCPRCS